MVQSSPPWGFARAIYGEAVQLAVMGRNFDHPDNIFGPFGANFPTILAASIKFSYLSIIYKNVRIFTVGVLTSSGGRVYKPDH
jgi:hypothetical protein